MIILPPAPGTDPYLHIGALTVRNTVGLLTVLAGFEEALVRETGDRLRRIGGSHKTVARFPPVRMWNRLVIKATQGRCVSFLPSHLVSTE